MNKICLSILVLMWSVLVTSNVKAQKAKTLASPRLVNQVNPFIGTGGHGHTFPGPTMPFGACQVGPDTRLEGWDGCSGYHYDDSVIYGFSHTHLSGTGCSDYGDILLMPVTKEMALDKYQYASKFSHSTEKAHAGFYGVFLNDPKVNVELTSTLHGGFHRYKYQMGSDMYVVLDLKHRDEVLDSKMEQVDDYTIRGYRFSKAWAKNQKVFYEIKFSQKIEHIIYEPIKQGTNTTAIQLDKSQHCLIKFENPLKYQSSTLPKLLAKVSISGVDEEGAHKNLVAEMPDDNWYFEKYKQQAEQEWEKELSKIDVMNDVPMSQYADKSTTKKNDQLIGTSAHQKIDTSANQLIIFYTALYHCMIHPSIYNDVDGRYRGRDDKIHNTEGKFNYYTVFSLWDTYRALHPLLTILDKKRTNDFINTFIKQYEQVGRLPIWELSSNETNCMIGYHVVSVIWDAYNKGIRDYDANKAYEAMKSIATHFTDYEGKGLDMKLKESAKSKAADADALESYCKFGYVRSDDSHESVSKTLEYAYDDWCIAQMANALGKKEDYKYYEQRSHNWMNVYDPTTGFMRARKNGCLYEPFSPYTVDNNYTEANAWQYSFYVPHDMSTLMSIQGGRDKFQQRINDLFGAKTKTEGREQADITGLIGQYAHGNEPSHHIPFIQTSRIYNYRTDQIVERVIDSFYLNKPEGLIGNEDCGQMSAWYVLAKIGLYQILPGSNEIQIANLFFKEVTLKGDINLKLITESSKNLTFDEKYRLIKSVDFKTLNNSVIHVSNVRLFSCVRDLKKLPPDQISVPFIICKSNTFRDSLSIKLDSPLPNSNKIYVSNDSMKTWVLNKDSFKLTQSKQLFFYCENDENSKGIYKRNEGSKAPNWTLNYPKSPIQTATFTKIPSDRKIILKNTYNKSYHAGGADGLMDGIYGKLNWRAGDWQGYQGQDVKVIMAFEKPKVIKSIAANFLEDQNSWIFYPKEVSFYVSNDSINWTLVENIPTNKSDHNNDVSISMFDVRSNVLQKLNSINGNRTSKFVKMIAKNFGPMPQWHEGRGEQTFIFIDELIVE